MDNQNKR